MAKPKHGRWNTQISLPSPHRPSSSRSPSPAVLSALALIATTTPAVAGGPLPTPPPTFLCPSIERDSIVPSLVTLAPRAATSAPPPTPAPTSQYSRRQAVADKYVQGSDSLWRKTDAWTLYGSTVGVPPSHSSGLTMFFQCCSSSTASTSSMQSPQSSSQTPIPTSTAEFDTSVLPAGWDASDLNPSESTIILALAIILAGSICVFMIGCVIWRRRKKKTRDLERKLAHKLSTDDNSQDNVQEKDPRGKMRMWARASARWKSNIRQSARRRRKKTIVSSTPNRSLSPTLSDSPQTSAVVSSTPSRRASFASQERDPPRPDTILCLDGNLTEPPHDPPRSASPPTYGASFVPGFSRLRAGSAASNPGSTSLPDSSYPVRPSNLLFFTEDEPLPYIPPSDGHVATDDKAQLAHIRELASSPSMVNVASASTIPAVSAPAWQEIEDDLEGLGIDLSEIPMSLPKFGLPPSFPLPPSKADVPFGYLDDLSIPVPGSSGPLLGASPSAPPVVDPGLEPSAPSLEGEDDLFQDWEGASSYGPEAPTSADLDPTLACAMEPSISPNVSSTSRASFPCIRESAARDGMLPRYYP